LYIRRDSLRRAVGIAPAAFPRRSDILQGEPHVKLMPKSLLLALAALTPLLAAASAAAQDLKPVAVVAITSVDETMADIGYLSTAAGMEDAGKMARALGGGLTMGIDKKRPMGMYVVPKDGDFHAIAFIPVTDLKTLLGVHKEYIGEPKDAGDGVLEIGMDKSFFVKEQSGWAFTAESPEHLTGLPKDPSTLLGDLAKNYNIAAKVLVQNVPQELRQTALDEIKVGLERALDNPPPGAQIDRAALEKTTRNSLKQIEQAFNEADEFTIGWAVDAAAKRTNLDVLITVKEGTELAKQLALNTEVTSSFAGVLLPEAAVTLNMSAKLSESDIAQMGAAFQALRDHLTRHIDDDPNLAGEQRTIAKEVMGKLLGVFEETAKTGKIDGGAALVLEPKSLSMVAGGYVADGAAFEASVKQILELAKNEPNVPKVQFNAAKHGNITLHRTSLPVPDEPEARDLLGEKLDVVMGIGPQAVYLAAGKGGESLLKKVIDQSTANASKPVPPMQFNVALLPILKFSASMDANNQMLPALISTLEKSGTDKNRNDKLIITSQTVARGSMMRIEIQEGVLKLVGAAVRQFTGGGGNFPGAE
jgi:hypothetical protein